MKSYKQYILHNVSVPISDSVSIRETFELPHISGKSKITTNIAPEKRTLKNLPRDSKGKPKCRFTDWLGLKGNGSKGHDGKYYGWSHRAITGIGVGDTIGPDHIAHKDADKKEKKDRKPYKIKSEKEAQEHAKRFMKQVS
jgi:hypothetical protein